MKVYDVYVLIVNSACMPMVSELLQFILVLA